MCQLDLNWPANLNRLGRLNDLSRAIQCHFKQLVLVSSDVRSSGYASDRAIKRYVRRVGVRLTPMWACGFRVGWEKWAG